MTGTDMAAASLPAASARGAPRIVVLDLGGVVVRICRSWHEGCTAAGIAHRPQVLEHLRRPALRELLDRHQRGEVECSAFHASMSQLMEGVYSPVELAAIHNAWTRGDYPGIKSAIDRIHIAGIDTACLSNTSASHWTLLQQSEAISRIRHQYASHLMGLAKPDAAIYRAFERATGYAPAEILFLDDLTENVTAAQECGWHAVQVDHTGDTAEQVLTALARAGVNA